jgi:NitT/TauT family transport system ATP-binding protein
MAGSFNAITADRLRKVYETPSGNVEAVAEASFEIAHGDFVSILGPSGCGKSTLMLMLAGLESATSGVATLDGLPVSGPQTEAGIACIGREIGDAGCGHSVQRRRRPVDGVLQMQALINDPRILLMDEPFSALDAITRDEMGLALSRIWDTLPKTAIFITHSIREAIFLSDRILVMGRRPSRIIEDLRVPFQRPRDPSVEAEKEFNDLYR